MKSTHDTTQRASSGRTLSMTVLFCLLLIACRAESMDPFELILDVDQSALESGRVVVQAQLRNVSNSDLSILPWNTPLDSRVTGQIYTVKRAAGQTWTELPYVGIMVKRMAPDKNDFSVISALQSVENTQDVTKSYSFCANSRYILNYSGVLRTLNDDFIDVETPAVEFSTGSAFPVCE